MRRRNNHRRAAFTLIELVASAVLAAMMMAALLSVVWSAVRQSSQMRRSATSRFAATQLIDQMRSDFQNARGMLMDTTGVTLHGFLARDPKTGQPLLVPGRVRYAAGRVGGQTVLTRSTDDNSAPPVWFGFSALRVEPLAEPDPENETLPEPETGGLPDMPLTFRVTMVGDQGQILWREVIHHHGE